MSLSMIWRRVNVPASSLTCLGPNAGVGKSPALALADHPDGLSSSPAVSVEHQISYIHFAHRVGSDLYRRRLTQG